MLLDIWCDSWGDLQAQELDSMIVMSPLQLSIFYDSMKKTNVKSQKGLSGTLIQISKTFKYLAKIF